MVPLEPDDQGSNDWTVAGKLTESGKPLLANDPHRTMAEPSLRYMIHLSAPGPHGTWDVVGAGEPGLPGVAVGHNQHIAWGFTIFPIDQQDLYIEQLNPVDPTEYRGPNGWERMRVEREQFRVKDRQPVDRELRFTRHGPVLWADAKRALVLHWVGTEPGTAGYLGSLAVDRAQNWEQFLGAMQRWKVPPENIVYADTSGNIGEQSAGLAPRRSWTGLLPVADDGKHEWQGFIPLDQLPRVFNPPGGFYATANHKVTSPGYPFNIGFEWSMPFRINRINELLGNAAHSGHQLGIANMQSMQTDVTSLAAKQLFEILRSAAASSSDAKVKLLLAWDGVLRRDSAVAALYEFWVRGLRQQLTRRVVLPNDPHSQQLIALIEPRLPLTVMIGWLQHPTAALFGSSPSAARDQLLVAAIGTAARDLAPLQGNDESKWSWGKLHAITFRHPLENVTSGTPTFLDLGPVERPGDGTTVNATAFSGSFAQTSGASYREIFDLSDWDNSVAVNTPGQSGQPASPHYSDLLQLWDQGQYFPLVYSRQAVEKNATEKLILQP
jgi:penicillin amidase